MAKKVTVEGQAVESKVIKSLLDESKEYTILGTGKRIDIIKDAEYLVGGQIENILIGKGFAVLK